MRIKIFQLQKSAGFISERDARKPKLLTTRCDARLKRTKFNKKLTTGTL